MNGTARPGPLVSTFSVNDFTTDETVIMINDDMTGVLMQCTSRIPLSYRRKAKAPASGALVIIKLSLLIAAIVAQLCQA